MKLFHAPASPFVRKVMIALHETNLLDQVTTVPVTVSPVASGDIVPDQNPLGKIPCLVLADGTSLYDSRVITRYLASLAPDAGLYPDGNALWKTLTLEATADGLMEAAVLMTYEMRIRPENMVYETWLDAQWLKIDRSLSALEAEWMPHLNGPKTMGVFAIAAALGYIDFRHNARNWRENHPVLAAWEAEISQHPTLVATAPAA